MKHVIIIFINISDRFETVIISTPDLYDYYLIEDSGVSVSGVPFLLFQLQACNDAHILLCQDRTQVYGDIYEIVIGKSIAKLYQSFPTSFDHFHALSESKYSDQSQHNRQAFIFFNQR